MEPWAQPDWRDAAVYAPVLAGGRQALAWELLRRDPAYRASVAKAGLGGDASGWGLHFHS
jgi:hypothetical protein